MSRIVLCVRQPAGSLKLQPARGAFALEGLFSHPEGAPPAIFKKIGLTLVPPGI